MSIRRYLSLSSVFFLCVAQMPSLSRKVVSQIVSDITSHCLIGRYAERIKFTTYDIFRICWDAEKGSIGETSYLGMFQANCLWLQLHCRATDTLSNLALLMVLLAVPGITHVLNNQGGCYMRLFLNLGLDVDIFKVLGNWKIFIWNAGSSPMQSI